MLRALLLDGVGPGRGRFHRDDLGLDDLAARTHVTHQELNLDVAGRQSTEEHLGLYRPLRAEIADGFVHVDAEHPHTRPELADAGVEGGQLLGSPVRIGCERRSHPCGGGVELVDVLGHHPVGVHLWPEGLEAAADHGAPGVSEVLGAVEQRKHLVFEELEQGVAVELGAPFVVGGVGAGDGPAIGYAHAVGAGVEALLPPSIEDRQVESAVECGLHPAGA